MLGVRRLEDLIVKHILIDRAKKAYKNLMPKVVLKLKLNIIAD